VVEPGEFDHGFHEFRGWRDERKANVFGDRHIDVLCVLCSVLHVKTIAVSEKAYARLASWKEGGDTFSSVIERLVPPKGTLPAALLAAQSLPELAPQEFQAFEEAVNATRQKLSGPWK
jgi:predicted CopG family antitoxin